MNIDQFLHYKISLFSMTGVFILAFIISWSVQQLVLGDNSQIDFTCHTFDQLYSDNGIVYRGGNIYCP